MEDKRQQIIVITQEQEIPFQIGIDFQPADPGSWNIDDPVYPSGNIQMFNDKLGHEEESKGGYCQVKALDPGMKELPPGDR